jgi:hypothetical protein
MLSLWNAILCITSVLLDFLLVQDLFETHLLELLPGIFEVLISLFFVLLYGYHSEEGS